LMMAPRNSAESLGVGSRNQPAPAPSVPRPSRILPAMGLPLASIFDAANLPCGLLGTVGYRVGSELREATRTTPEAPDVQRMLREMVDAGCRACAMEVSSHALSLRRVEGMSFAAGVFTNLTRDHLDFHADMEDYFQAKRRLFEMLPRDAPSLINIDDPRGLSLAEAGGRPVTYAINRPADITPGPLSFSLEGLAFDVRTPRGTIRVRRLSPAKSARPWHAAPPRARAPDVLPRSGVSPHSRAT